MDIRTSGYVTGVKGSKKGMVVSMLFPKDRVIAAEDVVELHDLVGKEDPDVDPVTVSMKLHQPKLPAGAGKGKGGK